MSKTVFVTAAFAPPEWGQTWTNLRRGIIHGEICAVASRPQAGER